MQKKFPLACGDERAPEERGCRGRGARKYLLLCVLILFITGCSPRQAPATTNQPTASGLFQVVRQPEKDPTVVVENKSDAHLRLLLNRTDGKLLKLDVPPQTEGKLTVPTGHYEAKVLDLDGRIDSAYGAADIGEYHSYRAAFTIYHDQRNHSFHIGDSSPMSKSN